jgi:hypothetical protein
MIENFTSSVKLHAPAKRFIFCQQIILEKAVKTLQFSTLDLLATASTAFSRIIIKYLICLICIYYKVINNC